LFAMLLNGINKPLSGHLRIYTFRSLRDLLKLHRFMVIKALGTVYIADKSFMVYMLGSEW
jgi:hypothetical protein